MLCISRHTVQDWGTFGVEDQEVSGGIEVKKIKPWNGPLTKTAGSAALAPLSRWAGITSHDIDAIMLTSVGKKWLADLTEEMYKNFSETEGMKMKAASEAAKAEILGTWNRKLHQVEDYMAIANCTSTVIALDTMFEDAKKDPNKKGFKRTHLSAADVFPQLIERLNEAQDTLLKEDGSIKAEEFKKCFKVYHDKYGLDYIFDSYELNDDFELETFEPFVDDSVFDRMSGWQIYINGVEDGEVADKVLTTVCMIAALSEEKRFKDNDIKRIVKRTKLLLKEANENRDVAIALSTQAKEKGLVLTERESMSMGRHGQLMILLDGRYDQVTYVPREEEGIKDA